ncbi:MAG: helix-turn-helix domain-containing protein [Gemmatimonadota bacterium]|nr:helix-turn-helix domain-containing protein [Gemmatimonadota bacterium]
MKIDANRLRTLRERKRLSRQQLSERSRTADPPGISARTIQRLENEPDKSKSTRKYTVMRLAEALDVEPDVLTGELPLPELDESPASEPDPVRIGAQIPPKARLAYDLIKRRYGVNATDVITMAPLFFALLAEGSLSWRLRNLKKTKKKAIRRLSEIQDKVGNRMFGLLSDYAYEAYTLEKESIGKADLFGDYLLEDHGYTINSLCDVPLDSTKENPLANYLRKLAADLDVPSVVDVDDGDLSFGSPAEFPDYDIWNDEIERITNGSADARRALETGFARLSEIPEQLVSEDKSDERQKLLADSLPEFYRGAKQEDPAGEIARMQSLSPKGDKFGEIVKKLSGETNGPESNMGGDDQ